MGDPSYKGALHADDGPHGIALFSGNRPSSLQEQGSLTSVHAHLLKAIWCVELVHVL